MKQIIEDKEEVITIIRNERKRKTLKYHTFACHKINNKNSYFPQGYWVKFKTQ